MARTKIPAKRKKGKPAYVGRRDPIAVQEWEAAQRRKKEQAAEKQQQKPLKATKEKAPRRSTRPRRRPQPIEEFVREQYGEEGAQRMIQLVGKGAGQFNKLVQGKASWKQAKKGTLAMTKSVLEEKKKASKAEKAKKSSGSRRTRRERRESRSRSRSQHRARRR